MAVIFGNRAECFSHLGLCSSGKFAVPTIFPSKRRRAALLYHTRLRGFHTEIHEAVLQAHQRFGDCATSVTAISNRTSADLLNEWLNGCAQCRCDLQPGGRFRERERLHRPRVARAPRWRDVCDREVPFSLLPNSAFAPRLGRWFAFRRNPENAVLVRTCSIMSATSNCRSPLPMSLAARISH